VLPGSITSACVIDPTCNGGINLCNTDDDCPGGRLCNGPAYQAMFRPNGYMKTCGTTVVSIDN
jgi:hypothetical protein